MVQHPKLRCFGFLDVVVPQSCPWHTNTSHVCVSTRVMRTL